MAENTDKHVVEPDEMLVRPGTYFNPQTEVVVVVTDDVSIDQEIFNMEPYEGADWVRLSDEVPVDTDDLDSVIQGFQTDHVDIDAMTEAKFEEDLDAEDDEDDGDDDLIEGEGEEEVAVEVEEGEV